jgi:allantoin racemase
MTKINSEASGKSTRIWYQSFVDPVTAGPYISRLEEHLAKYATDGVHFDVHGMSPPDGHLGALTEFRCAAQTIRNAIQAEKEGYDAFVIGHFQEPGLVESRTAVDIPVIGLGESAMLHACTLGRTFGLITINPVFIPWHQDQITRYGLGQRATGVRALNTQVSHYVQAFDDEAAYQQVRGEFCREAALLVNDGAEVLIPAGGLPMLLLAREKNFSIDGAVVPNGIAVVAAMAETALRLYQQTGITQSRKGTFAKAPQEAIQEFLDS